MLQRYRRTIKRKKNLYKRLECGTKNAKDKLGYQNIKLSGVFTNKRKKEININYKTRKLQYYAHILKHDSPIQLVLEEVVPRTK